MNRISKTGIAGITAVMALAAGAYLATDSFAHGPGGMGWGGILQAGTSGTFF